MRIVRVYSSAIANEWCVAPNYFEKESKNDNALARYVQSFILSEGAKEKREIRSMYLLIQLDKSTILFWTPLALYESYIYSFFSLSLFGQISPEKKLMNAIGVYTNQQKSFIVAIQLDFLSFVEIP